MVGYPNSSTAVITSPTYGKAHPTRLSYPHVQGRLPDVDVMYTHFPENHEVEDGLECILSGTHAGTFHHEAPGKDS